MWLPPLLTLLVAAGPFVIVHGGRSMISCACNTRDCQKLGSTTCNTTELCFSQWLDRRDGSDPLIRGCVNGRTPLLCENRRPSVATHRQWPLLLCCDKNMCNARAAPTPPPLPTSSPSPPSLVHEEAPTAPIGGKDAIYLVMVGVGVCCFGLVTCIALIFSRRAPACCDPECGARRGYVKGCPEPPRPVVLQQT